MPGEVHIQSGNMFDVECDLLVVPISTRGTVTTAIAEALERRGISPSHAASEAGDVRLVATNHTRYDKQFIAYATSVQGDSSSPAIITRIGRCLGALHDSRFRRISAPLLGAGAGGLTPEQAATALRNGFLETAVEGMTLIVSVLDRSTFGRLNDLSKIGVSPTLTESTPNVAARRTLGATSGRRRTKVFISYSHKDRKWLDMLRVQLAPLERSGVVDRWDDSRLAPGTKWKQEIANAIAEAKVAVLIVSGDFLASGFIATNELPPLLVAAEHEGTRILPLIVRPCRFTETEELSHFQAVNDPARPLAKMSSVGREEELVRLTNVIVDALKSG